MVDESNPRGVAFQLAAIQEHVQQLPHALERPFRSAEEQAVLRALTRVRLSDITQLVRPQGTQRRMLVAELDALLADLPEVSDSLTRHYLAHAVAVRTFGSQPSVPSW